MDVTFMGAEPRMNRGLSWWRYRYRAVLAVLLLPSLLLIGVFSYYPAVRSLIGGFYSWNGFSAPAYAGIAQFRQYIQAPTFGTEARNLAILTGGSIAISLVSQFTAAETVTHMPRRAAAVAKYVLVLPIVLPPLVLIEVWAYLPAAGPSEACRREGTLRAGWSRCSSRAQQPGQPCLRPATGDLVAAWLQEPSLVQGLARFVNTEAIQRELKTQLWVQTRDNGGPLRWPVTRSRVGQDSGSSRSPRDSMSSRLAE